MRASLPLPDPVQQAIREMRAAGSPFHAIAASLNRAGWRGPGGGRWFAASVRRVSLRDIPWRPPCSD